MLSFNCTTKLDNVIALYEFSHSNISQVKEILSNRMKVYTQINVK